MGALTCVHLPQQHAEAVGVGAHGEVALERLGRHVADGAPPRDAGVAGHAVGGQPEVRHLGSGAQGAAQQSEGRLDTGGIALRIAGQTGKYMSQSTSVRQAHADQLKPLLPGHLPVQKNTPGASATPLAHSRSCPPSLLFSAHRGLSFPTPIHLGGEAAAVCPAAHEQHVAGLEVSVHHAAGVQVAHALRDLARRAQQRAQRDLVVPLGAAAEQALGDGLVQTAAVAVLRKRRKTKGIASLRRAGSLGNRSAQLNSLLFLLTAGMTSTGQPGRRKQNEPIASVG